jgi:hypothetical protein
VAVRPPGEDATPPPPPFSPSCHGSIVLIGQLAQTPVLVPAAHPAAAMRPAYMLLGALSAAVNRPASSC